MVYRVLELFTRVLKSSSGSGDGGNLEFAAQSMFCYGNNEGGLMCDLEMCGKCY